MAEELVDRVRVWGCDDAPECWDTLSLPFDQPIRARQAVAEITPSARDCF